MKHPIQYDVRKLRVGDTITSEIGGGDRLDTVILDMGKLTITGQYTSELLRLNPLTNNLERNSFRRDELIALKNFLVGRYGQ